MAATFDRKQQRVGLWVILKRNDEMGLEDLRALWAEEEEAIGALNRLASIWRW